MNTHHSPDDFKLAFKVEKVRGDERGSLTLLAGMMVFLTTIFAIIAFDTNKAIYDRIVAQNAVDSAADSAALWQARFCNVEQQLNNLHYTVDEALCIAEGVSATMCGVAIPLEVIQDIPFCDPEAEIAFQAACVICDLLPAEDAAQHDFYQALVGTPASIQEDIAYAAPFLAFGYANANAYGSGADNIFDATSQTLGEVAEDGISMFGISTTNMSSTIDSINSVVGSTLGQIPIYAAPIDPTRLWLYVSPTNNGNLPESWPAAVPYAGNLLGIVGCEEFEIPYPEACSDVLPEYDPFGSITTSGDTTRMDSPDKYHPSWGWNDQYEYGNPGYMTWLAGVTSRTELLGLSNLVWLNSTTTTTPPNTMYSYDNAVGNYANPLTVPAYLAIASSQVEGTTVVEQGDVNAVGVLMRVYIPTGTNFPGTKIPFPFTIYH
jgi:hypothetical protein